MAVEGLRATRAAAPGNVLIITPEYALPQFQGYLLLAVDSLHMLPALHHVLFQSLHCRPNMMADDDALGKL